MRCGRCRSPAARPAARAPARARRREGRRTGWHGGPPLASISANSRGLLGEPVGRVGGVLHRVGAGSDCTGRRLVRPRSPGAGTGPSPTSLPAMWKCASMLTPASAPAGAREPGPATRPRTPAGWAIPSSSRNRSTPPHCAHPPDGVEPIPGRRQCADR